MKYSIVASTALMVLAVVSYLVLGATMRMIADDYCMTANLEEMGPGEMVGWYYTSWSGQFTYPFVKALTHYSLGLNAYPVLPILIYVTWWLGNICLIGLVLRQWGWQAPFKLSLSLGTIHLFMLLSTMASRQTMYWQDALLFHALPFALFVWIVAAWFIAIQSPQHKTLKMALFVVVCFIYGGMHILSSLFGLAFWTLALLIVWRFYRQHQIALPLTLAALIATAAAFSIVLIAPGNFQRLEAYQDIDASISIIDAVQVALVATLDNWFRPFSLAHILLITMSTMAVCGIWYAWGYIPDDKPIIQTIRRHTWSLIGIALLLGVLYTWASLFLPAMSSGRTPTRVFVSAGLTKTWVTLWIGLVLGLRYTRTAYFPATRLAVTTLALSLLLVAGAYRIYGNVQLLPHYIEWSHQWDARHNALIDAAQDGAVAVEVAPFTVDLPKFLGPETDGVLPDFVRFCMARYYGIPTIEANTELGDGVFLRIKDTP